MNKSEQLRKYPLLPSFLSFTSTCELVLPTYTWSKCCLSSHSSIPDSHPDDSVFLLSLLNLNNNLHKKLEGQRYHVFFQDLDPFEVKYKTAGVRGCLWSEPFVCLGRLLQYSTLKSFTSPHPLNSASPQNSSSFCFKSLTNFHRAKVFKISAEYC